MRSTDDLAASAEVPPGYLEECHIDDESAMVLGRLHASQADARTATASRDNSRTWPVATLPGRCLTSVTRLTKPSKRSHSDQHHSDGGYDATQSRYKASLGSSH